MPSGGHVETQHRFPLTMYFLVMGLESVSTFTVGFLLTKSWAFDFRAETFLTQITESQVILTNSQEILVKDVNSLDPLFLKLLVA